MSSVQSLGLKPSKSAHSFSHLQAVQIASEQQKIANRKPAGDDDSVQDYTSINEDWNSIGSSNVYTYNNTNTHNQNINTHAQVAMQQQQQQQLNQPSYSFQHGSQKVKQYQPSENQVVLNSMQEERQLNFGNPQQKAEEISVDFRISSYSQPPPSNNLPSKRFDGGEVLGVGSSATAADYNLNSNVNSQYQQQQQQHLSYQQQYQYPSENMNPFRMQSYGMPNSSQMDSQNNMYYAKNEHGGKATTHLESTSVVGHLHYNNYSQGASTNCDLTNNHNSNNSRGNLSDISAIYAQAMNTYPVEGEAGAAGAGQTMAAVGKQNSQQNQQHKRNSSLGSVGKVESIISLSSKPSEILRVLQKNSSTTMNVSQATTAVSKEHQQEYAQKLYDQDGIYKTKKQKLAEEAVKQQMDACTFMPKINEHGSSKRSSSQFSEMQTQFLNYVQEKRQMVKEHIEEKRMSEVTDRPKILAKSKQIMESKRASEGPAFERLYSLHSKKDGLTQQCTDNSEMNVSSQQHQKYYITKDIAEEARRLQEIESKENTFHPSIHRKSKSLIRNEKIDDILYKDAQRRQTKQLQEQKNRKLPMAHPSQAHTKLSIEREQLLVSKFAKELHAVAVSIHIDDSNGNCQLQLNDLFEILSRLGFIKSQTSFMQDKSLLESEHRLVLLIWSLIGGERFGFIPFQNLVIFLHCVLGLNMYKSSSPQNTDSSFIGDKENTNSELQPSQHQQLLSVTGLESQQQQQQQSQQQQQQRKEQNDQMEFRSIHIGSFEETKHIWIIGIEDKKVIRQAFEVLYLNRLASEELRNNKHDWEFSFQPYVSHSSSILANQHREKKLTQAARLLDAQEISMKLPEDGKITHQQLLVLQKLTQDSQMQKKKQEKEREEMKECSFHPKISALHSRTQSSGASSSLYQNQQNFTGENMMIMMQQQQQQGLPSNASQFRNEEQQQFFYDGQMNLQQQFKDERGTKKTEELFLAAAVKSTKNKRDKTQEEFEFERMGEECTFHPDIHKGRKFYKQDRVVAKDVDKSIDRIRAAQKEREHINIQLSRGYTQSNLLNKTTNNGSSMISGSTKHLKTSSSLSSHTPTGTLKDSPNRFFKAKPPIPLANIKRSTTGKSNATGLGFDASLQEISQTQTSQIQSSCSQQQIESNMSSHQNQNVLYGQNFILNSLQQQQPMQELPGQQQQQHFSGISAHNTHDEKSSQSHLPMNEILPASQYYYSTSSEQTYTASLPEKSAGESIYNTQANANVNVPINIQGNYQQYAQGQVMQSQQQQQVQYQQQQQQQLQQHQQQQQYIQSNVAGSSVPVQQVAPKIAANISPNLAADDEPEPGSQAWKQEEKIPLLFVDVNLGLGRTERIVVFEGDRSEDLANKFAQIHNLDSVTKQKFKELLDSQIAGLLSRIDEEEMLSFDSESQNQSGQTPQQFTRNQPQNHGTQQQQQQQQQQPIAGMDSQNQSERMMQPAHQSFIRNQFPQSYNDGHSYQQY